MPSAPRFDDLDAQGSFSWIAHPDEWMERASAALVVESGTYLVDPVDVPELHDRLADDPPVVGIIRLLNRHGRDGDALAERYGVPLIAAYDNPGSVHPDLVIVPVANALGWREAMIWMPTRRLLVVAEAVGTVEYFLARSGAPLGMHPVLRCIPPRRVLRGWNPAVIAVGHGAPLRHADAGRLLDEVVGRARRDLPRAWFHALATAIRRRRASSRPH